MKQKRLTETGAEILDTTPLAVPLAKFSDQSETQMVLQAVIKREFEKLRMQNGLVEMEEFEDEFDFEVEDETPQPTQINRYSNVTKRELQEKAKKHVKKQQKQTADEIPVSRKSAKTDRAQHVGVDKINSDKLADEVPTEGASQSEE